MLNLYNFPPITRLYVIFEETYGMRNMLLKRNKGKQASTLEGDTTFNKF